MIQIQNSKPLYNLEEKTFHVAIDVGLFVKPLPSFGH
jgi:hypothetical protein